MMDVITEDGEEVTVYEEIQIIVPKEFRRGVMEAFEPRIELEGGPFPSDGAIPKWLANDVYDEEMINLHDHDITVVDMDEADRL